MLYDMRGEGLIRFCRRSVGRAVGFCPVWPRCGVCMLYIFDAYHFLVLAARLSSLWRQCRAWCVLGMQFRGICSPVGRGRGHIHIILVSLRSFGESTRERGQQAHRRVALFLARVLHPSLLKATSAVSLDLELAALRFCLFRFARTLAFPSRAFGPDFVKSRYNFFCFSLPVRQNVECLLLQFRVQFSCSSLLPSYSRLFR